ncbi:hypothetical protein [Glaciecola sp. KUL10]|uniref:hypothetical protein n=1 Tax=Glaciecola sp. (strain KUL10) TaxID=2161813 RepID=UPI000D7865FD|nr:hypothetical protein [Glaciecola sp. KUL10]GBL05790.1 transposon mobilization protein homolog [Glaciecola sp. KUL10]
MDSNKAFVAVKARYYKFDDAKLVLDHVVASRKGFTQSSNVFPSLSSKNIGVVTKGCRTAIDALDRANVRYKQATGKKIRSDFNVLFDHVVVLSEPQYAKLEKEMGEEKAKRLVLSHMIKYANEIKKEFGFEPISVQLHLDEGHLDSSIQVGSVQRNKNDVQSDEGLPTSGGRFVRNVHCHCSFYNFDFKAKKAPLRYLMKKGRDRKGRTKSSNPHFEKMQDIAAQIFSQSPLNFKRGISKNVTGAKHLEKEAFVREKLAEREVALVSSNNKVNELNDEIKNHQKRTALLSEEIQKLQKKHDWLSAKVDELHSYFLRLDQALRSRCQNAIMQIQAKVKKLVVSNKPSL